MTRRSTPCPVCDRGRAPIPIGARYTGYTILFLLLACVVNAIARIGDMAHYDDGGLVEWVQLGILSAGLIMLLAAVRLSPPPARGLPVVLACLMALAMVRELDTVFDRLFPIPWAEWKLPAALVAALLLAVLWQNRALLGPQVRAFAGTPACALFWAGLCTVAYAQMTGHERYWLPLLQNFFVRGVKRVSEETIEILGHLFLFAGSAEYLAGVIRKARAAAAPEPPGGGA